MDKKYNHLLLIENVIKRMANNSFLLKGWTLTLFTGLFVLVNRCGEKYFGLVVFLPIVAFWCLDSFYLLQENYFRALYEKVMQTNEDDIDFSLKATKKEFGSEENCFWACFKSKTESIFYVSLLVVCGLINIIIFI